MIGNRFGIEQDNIGGKAFFKTANLLKPQIIRGQAGHFAYGFRQGQYTLIPNVTGQDPRESPLSPGVAIIYAAISVVLSALGKATIFAI